VTVLAVSLAALRLAIPVTRPDDAVTPGAALAHVPPALAALPMLNNYNFGGYLIFRGVKPFIDGRSDMYGDEHFRRYLQVMACDPASLDAAIRQYGVAWSLLVPRDPLVRVLDVKPGWRRVYGDRYGVVHVRTSALKSGGPQLGEVGLGNH